MSGFVAFRDIGQNHGILGLNIEGNRPLLNLPLACDWYNLILVLDEPFRGVTFDDVSKKAVECKHERLEQCIDGFDEDQYIDQLVQLISRMKEKYDPQHVLLHIHQYQGSTNLHEILEHKTGVRAIVDAFNFCSTPVNYAEQYPAIRCLFSISQCASMHVNLRAGTLICPTAFLLYNVNEETVNTSSLSAQQPNMIWEFLEDIEHVKGPILVVNDLWNPTQKQIEEDGVLFLDSEDQHVLNFVVKSTKDVFDESHNYQHALRVAKAATRIRNTKVTLYLALLHDVCDHKYPLAISRQQLTSYVARQLGKKFLFIDDLIDKVSFSKQGKDMSRVHPALEAVRDADRLEALGLTGIKRCVAFAQKIGGQVPEDVVAHCFNKLLRLLPDNYIVTALGRRLAVTEHNAIVDFVNEHLPLCSPSLIVNKVPSLRKVPYYSLNQENDLDVITKRRKVQAA